MSFRQNLLLAALSDNTRSVVLDACAHVELPLRTILEEPGEQPQFVHFITSGLTSVVVEMKTGGTAEVALAGNEGVSGSLALLGPARSSTRCFMQVGGDGFRIRLEQLRAIFNSSEEVRSRVQEFTQHQALTCNQLSACGLTHPIAARLARWLLMVQDRVHSNILQLSHVFLAEMLGVHRPTLSVSIKALEKSGLIDNRRLEVEILDRPRLELAACECYPVTKRLLDTLYQGSAL